MITATIAVLTLTLLIATLNHFRLTSSPMASAASTAAIVGLVWAIPGAMALTANIVGFAFLALLWGFCYCGIRWAHRQPLPRVKLGMVSDGNRTGLALAIAV